MTGGMLGSNGTSCFGSHSMGSYIFVAVHAVIFVLLPTWILLPFLLFILMPLKIIFFRIRDSLIK